MDRKIIYPAQIPLVEDQLQAARFAQIGIGRVAGALYGEGGTGASGFGCTPGNGLTITIAPGEIVIPGVVDTISYGALPASTSALPRQFILVDPVSITVPSASGTYIIYGTPATNDIGNAVLPYFNSANPSQTYAGSGNSGAGQPTVRSDAVTIGIGASTPSGSVPLWSVSVPSGATTIASSMISPAVGAPLYPSLNKIASCVVAPFNPSLAAAFGGYPAKSIVADPTTVGAYWVSTADDNLTTPGASDASWQSLFAGLATQSFAEQFSPGRLLSINNFTNGQTYTPSAQARKILVEIAGAGGAGGGAFGSHANSPSASACGGAGASGGFARILIDLTQVNLSGGIPLVVGGGGQCDYGIAGGGGSYSSFGNYLIANGGDGGKTTGSTAAGQAAWCAQSLGGTVTYGAPPPGMTVLDAITGANGMSGFLVPNGSNASVPVPPVGADAPFGTGGANGITQSGQQRGETARGFGAGGGGMGTQGGDSVAGGSGAPGLVRIWEFS